jgi:hypothetical protein
VLGTADVGGAMEMSVGAGVLDISSPPHAARGSTSAARPAARPALRRDDRGTTMGTDTKLLDGKAGKATLPSRPQRPAGQPRPTYGMAVAITVMVSTFASGGRLAM